MTQHNYGFVPFETQQVGRESFEDYAHDQLRADLHHGQWTFCLTNTTNILINTGTTEDGYPKEKNATKTWLKSKHPDHAGQPVIPGSSLKGMVRSVYEVLTHSCLFLASKQYKDQKESKKNHPVYLHPNRYEVEKKYHPWLESCQKKNGPVELCPACRMFGTITKGKRNPNWKGRVFISDGLLQNSAELMSKMVDVPLLFAPRPKSRSNSEKYPDYFLQGKMAGRKSYLVRRKAYGPSTNDRLIAERSDKIPIVKGEALKPYHHFTVRVRYQNLTGAEVEALWKSILLEDGLRHLLGTAKAHGWGACYFTLTDWQTMDPAARYRGGSGMETIPESASDTKVKSLLQADGPNCPRLYHPSAFEHLRKLRTPTDR